MVPKYTAVQSVTIVAIVCGVPPPRASGLNPGKPDRRPRLLSDNEPSYVAKGAVCQESGHPAHAWKAYHRTT